MPAANYDLFVEKGVDFSLQIVLQRGNGDFIDLSSPDVCVKADIVEFHGLPPVASFNIQEIPPSGVFLSLQEEDTKKLPFGKCYYDIVLNTNGDSERLVQGIVYTSEAATTNISCP